MADDTATEKLNDEAKADIVAQYEAALGQGKNRDEAGWAVGDRHKVSPEEVYRVVLEAQGPDAQPKEAQAAQPADATPAEEYVYDDSDDDDDDEEETKGKAGSKISAAKRGRK